MAELSSQAGEEAASNLARRVGGAFPSAFAFVMATGIISVDAIQVGSEQIGLALLAINITAWLLLWLTGFIRAFLGPRESCATSAGTRPARAS